jgi:hypothetical protein
MVIEDKLLITWPETAAILLEYRTLLPVRLALPKKA